MAVETASKFGIQKNHFSRVQTQDFQAILNNEEKQRRQLIADANESKRKAYGRKTNLTEIFNNRFSQSHKGSVDKEELANSFKNSQVKGTGGKFDQL